METPSTPPKPSCPLNSEQYDDPLPNIQDTYVEMTGMTPDSLQDVVDKLGTSCLKRNRSFGSSVDESSCMGKKLKRNDTLSSTSSFESNKSRVISNEDSKADMETDMVFKPSSPRNQSPNSNHNPTPPPTDPEPKPSTPPKKAPSKHVPTFMEAPYWTFNIQNSKDRSKDKGVKCSQTLALAIKFAFESFIQGAILQMWGPRDHLGPTFSVPRQHRQLANKFEKTSEFKDLQKELFTLCTHPIYPWVEEEYN